MSGTPIQVESKIMIANCQLSDWRVGRQRRTTKHSGALETSSDAGSLTPVTRRTLQNILNQWISWRQVG